MKSRFCWPHSLSCHQESKLGEKRRKERKYKRKKRREEPCRTAALRARAIAAFVEKPTGFSTLLLDTVRKMPYRVGHGILV